MTNKKMEHILLNINIIGDMIFYLKKENKDLMKNENNEYFINEIEKQIKSIKKECV